MARRYDSRTYVCSPVFSPALEVAPTRVLPAANADAVSPPPSPGARTQQNNLLARGASLPGRVCFGEYQLVCSTVSPRRRNGLGFWLGASGARWGLIDEAPTGEGSRGAGLELSVFPFTGAGSLHSKAAPPPTPPLSRRARPGHAASPSCFPSLTPVLAFFPPRPRRHRSRHPRPRTLRHPLHLRSRSLRRHGCRPRR